MSVERFAASDLSRPGTTVRTWDPWIRALPVADPHALVPGALQIVAPHPDDEVLGVGAFTAFLTDHGHRATILAVTDGEASHPGSPTHTPDALAALRRRESADAAEILGVDTIVRLGLPDGAVAAHENELTTLLTEHLEPGATVAIPLRNDGHPDHEATARAALAAARACAVRVIEYPIWMWHWSFPRDPEIDWARAHRLDLPPGHSRRKRRAAERFRSQIRPLSGHPADAAVLAPHVTARLLALDEVVLI